MFILLELFDNDFNNQNHKINKITKTQEHCKMIAKKLSSKKDSPKSPLPNTEAPEKTKVNKEIRCTCRRLLAKQTSDGTGIEVQCPRCKRTWTFKLGPL